MCEDRRGEGLARPPASRDGLGRLAERPGDRVARPASAGRPSSNDGRGNGGAVGPRRPPRGGSHVGGLLGPARDGARSARRRARRVAGMRSAGPAICVAATVARERREQARNGRVPGPGLELRNRAVGGPPARRVAAPHDGAPALPARAAAGPASISVRASAWRRPAGAWPAVSGAASRSWSCSLLIGGAALLALLLDGPIADRMVRRRAVGGIAPSALGSSCASQRRCSSSSSRRSWRWIASSWTSSSFGLLLALDRRALRLLFLGHLLALDRCARPRPPRRPGRARCSRTASAVDSAARSKRSAGSERRMPPTAGVPSTGPERCWTTWVSSWASVRSCGRRARRLAVAEDDLVPDGVGVGVHGLRRGGGGAARRGRGRPRSRAPKRRLHPLPRPAPRAAARALADRRSLTGRIGSCSSRGPRRRRHSRRRAGGAARPPARGPPL